jgi:DNA-binding IclR family transcriptional regulator
VLGQAYLSSAGLERAQPILRKLCRDTNESVSLASLHGKTALVVLQEHSPLPLRVDHLQGKELVLHASAMGKVLLAFGTSPVDTSVATLGPLEKFTERTFATAEALVDELRTIQTKGYATNHGERYDGANGVAVPVLASGSTSSAYALGIQGPDARLNDARLNELLDMCRQAAADIAALNL